MPKKVLIIFAHPRLEKSRNHALLIKHVPQQAGITFVDLYEKYPEFNIDVDAEKKLLSEHDVVVWQHPFYWYSAPPLLKQWIDMVLEFGWAYGPGGNALEGKIILNAITTGGTREVYSPEGRNRFTINQFLAPFDQTATLCKMSYLPPFVIHGTHRLDFAALQHESENYFMILEKLAEGQVDVKEVQKYAYINDWWEAEKSK